MLLNTLSRLDKTEHLSSIRACPSRRVVVLDMEALVEEVADIVEVLVVESGGG